MRTRSLGPTQESPLFARRITAAAATLSLIVLPAPPAAAHADPVAQTVPALLLPPDPGAATRLAAERAARTFTRRMVPAELRPVMPKTLKAAKPAVKKQTPKSTPKAPARQKTTVETAPVKASGGAAAIVAFAYSIVGRPYVYGASGPSGYDCSGVLVAAYRRIGVHLPHKAAAFYGVGRPVSRSQLRPGDIIIMNGGKHAGVFVGDGKMIHAPGSGRRVTVAPIWKFSAARRIVG